MYSFIWDIKTRGYLLTNQTGRYVANEIRPVFAPELALTGLGSRFEYDKNELRPLLWAQKNVYIVADLDDDGNTIGKKIVKLNETRYGKPLSPEFFFKDKFKLKPVDIVGMVEANNATMNIIVADAKRRTKELFDNDISRCDIAYIAFSGGKDSVVLLDICHKVLPLSVPVIFSDTDMELPDTYNVWSEIQHLYPDRDFFCAKADVSALENWRRFAPPSRTIRWCCSVHKTTPAIMFLKEKLQKSSIQVMAFVGVRGDESNSRSTYEDATDGVKSASQLNRMPILDWGSHELWLYILANNLLINCAYKKGLSRVGCSLCPESSEKYAWFVDRAYPRILKPYNDIIIETSNKTFKTEADRTEFIGSLCWQARKSGAVLKETLSAPLEEHDNLNVTFQSPNFSKDIFFEWIKTIGTVVKERGTGIQKLKLPKTLDNGFVFKYVSPYTGGGLVTFEFQDISEKISMLPILKAFMKKVTSCIACRCCEAECAFGAIMFTDGRIKIDGAKCVKCHKCYEIDNACWRYMSMRVPEKSNSPTFSINNYKNFGLREGNKELWVSMLVEMGNNFFPWHTEHPLGEPKVKSAKNWFIQASLIDGKTRKTTALVELFRLEGGASPLGWEIIWLSLANKSDLVHWFVTATKIGEPYSPEQLLNMLGASKPNFGKSTLEGGLAALKDMLTKSPLGGDDSVTSISRKGKTLQNITRNPKEVKPISILFGLYLIATMSNRESFTVRELLTSAEDTFVSPLIAFGISPDTFKKQCEGLRSKYPDFIDTVFTHGNDEINIFPKNHTIENIISLALEV